MTGTSPLQLTGVSKSYGSVDALVDIDIEMAPGELLALVGPSGCGKSTLLRAVAGLTAADAGTVRIAGDVVDDGSTRVDPEHRHVGLVFQEHALFPHMTVADNVAFGLRGIGRAERSRRRDQWLGVVGLGDHGSRYPHELSGGERQRVALARALAPEPRLMLLDEPFASLDPNLRTQVRADVVRILTETGTPAVFVTHDQVEALAFGHRVAVMRRGRIEHIGTPEVVFTEPANHFVAGFMGEANFLVADERGATELGTLDGDDAVEPGAEVLVRPDDVVLSEGPGGVEAEVVAAEYRGPIWSYTLRLPSGTIVRSTLPHTTRFELGDRVRVTIGEHHPVIRPSSI
jgi:iron(III) transport system ATP-binding protein